MGFSGVAEGAVSRLLDLLDAEELRHLVAILVFGSVARGDEDDQSDLDVLVVVSDRDTRKRVQRRLSADLGRPFSPLLLTVDALIEEGTAKPSFVAHLLDEGLVAYESEAWPAVRASLARAVLDRDALRSEVRARARDLEPLSHPERFRTSPVTALSHIYGIARSLVIARLLEEGIHEYRWKQAFDKFAEIRPDLRTDLDALKALRPYYEYARAREGAALPEREVAAEEVRQLVSTVEQLAE